MHLSTQSFTNCEFVLPEYFREMGLHRLLYWFSSQRSPLKVWTTDHDDEISVK